LGRRGYGHLGVSPSGAADPVALRLGNRLVGNPESAAALEMTLAGGRFRFPDGAVVALAGADFEGAPLWTTLEVGPGQTLSAGAARSGAHCYLCVRGGIAVPLFLGSASTQLACGLGGLDGRRLRRGDLVEIAATQGPAARRALSSRALEYLAPSKTLRITRGPEWESFDASSRETFLSTPYRVATDSDRAGLRLEGEPLKMRGPGRMITEGVDLGSIQAPPSGQPIILFVEQQTTGGYPRIGVVASVDLFRLGQLRPGDEVRFSLLSLEEAIRLICEQERLLASEEFLFGD
jgi:antagonist of KipI